MLQTALDSHPDCRCYGLLFTNNADNLKNATAAEFIKSRKFRDTHGFVATATPGRGSESVQRQVVELWDYVEKNQLPVVCLERRDVLRQMASDIISRTTGLYSIPLSKPQNRTTSTVVIRPEALLRFRDTVQRVNSITAVRFQWSHVVQYEDLLSNWDREIAAILDYLKLRRIRLGAMTRRQETRKIRNIIYNYEDLKSELYSSFPDVFDIAEHTDEIFSY